MRIDPMKPASRRADNKARCSALHRQPAMRAGRRPRMSTKRASSSRVFRLGVLLALVTGVGTASAAESTNEVVAQSQRTRNGAGLQVSSWQPDEPTGFRNSQTIAVQGYMEKGLDLHLAWENTLGYWRRT